MSGIPEHPILKRILESVRAELDPEFDFVSPGSIPFVAPPGSAQTLSVCLVTTAGLHLKGDRPFRTHEDPLGDTSYRVIPAGTAPSGLDLSAPYVDRRHVPLDPEVALPLRALEALHRESLAGPPAARHASFTSGIVRPLPGLEKSGGELATMLEEDGAGAAIFLPTCPLCIQTVCLLARLLEAGGIRTVCVTLLPELSRIVGAPRSLAVKFPFGAPCGDPGHRSLHKAVLREALDLIRDAREPGVVKPSRLAWRRD